MCFCRDTPALVGVQPRLQWLFVYPSVKCAKRFASWGTGSGIRDCGEQRSPRLSPSRASRWSGNELLADSIKSRTIRRKSKSNYAIRSGQDFELDRERSYFKERSCPTLNILANRSGHGRIDRPQQALARLALVGNRANLGLGLTTKHGRSSARHICRKILTRASFTRHRKTKLFLRI